MSEFRKIVVRPLANFDALGLNINEKKEIKLPPMTQEQVDGLHQLAAKLVKQGNGIIASQMEGERFVNTNFKTSAEKKYVNFPEPNPVCIYYKAANEHLEKSLQLREAAVKREASVQENYEAVVEYFQETSEGVTSLCKTVEGFVNQQIPDDTAIEIDGKKGKKDLEWLPIGRKIRALMLELKGKDFYVSHPIPYSKITEMIALRDDLTHLKTAIKDNYTVYEDLHKRLADFKHVECSEAVFTFVNTMVPDYFVEQEKELPAAEKVG